MSHPTTPQPGRPTPHVLIAGGGIGGLTLAVALRQAGVRATVFERASELTAAGAGITVQANALAALRTLGLADAVVAEGHPLSAGAVLDWAGRPLLRFTPEAARQLTEAVGPNVALHRARLQAVLLAAARQGGTVHTGRGVVGFREEAGRVEVALSDGTRAGGDVLVGADGLHSVVRQQLLGDGAPRYAGYTSWRGVVPAQAGLRLTQTSESWGRGARFGLVPLGHGETYWFATLNAPAGERDAPGGARARLLSLFGGWHAPIRQVLEATPEERILRTDICDRPPAARWSAGRVTLLGDAAHPMTPNMGQGGCQAIEDAVVLAACLSGGLDVPAALAAYEARRRARANRIVTQSLRLGRVAQWESAPARRVRDALLRLVPPAATVRQLRAVMTFRA